MAETSSRAEAALFLASASYARPNSPTLQVLLRRRAELLFSRLREAPARAEGGVANATAESFPWQSLFATLSSRAGITAGALGLHVQPGATWPRPGLDAEAHSALQSALQLLVFADGRPFGKLMSGNVEWAQRLWQADAPVLLRSSANAPARPLPGGKRQGDAGERLLSSLLDDGFVQIHDLGLDTAALARQAWAALAKHGVRSGHGDLVTASTRLPALEPLLHNQTLARAIRGYLGGSARFDSYATFQLTPNATTETYPSGFWHHDRCGRRLRMFVYVHDVPVDGRPTLAAKGSHRTFAYYSYLEALSLTRFSDDLVRRLHEVVPLTGRAGGGFLLDTNALHRAQLDGRQARTAILLEWHAHGKVPSLVGHPAARYLPCPSVKAGPHDWKLGVPGYSLYPPDVAANARADAAKAPASRAAATSRKAERRGSQKAARASPMALTGVNVPQSSLDGTGTGTGGVASVAATRAAAAPIFEPRTTPAELAADSKAAARCFGRPRKEGCAAAFIVAPALSSVGGARTWQAFVAMAADSARRLKRLLPTARAVLVLGGALQGDPARESRGGGGEGGAQIASAARSGGSDLAAFEHIIPWHEPRLIALAATYYPAHLGWLLKPSMLAAAAAEYSQLVFFDADTVPEHPAVVGLFAILESRAVDTQRSQDASSSSSSLSSSSADTDAAGGAPPHFFAAPEVPTSRSRQALGGLPIFNSGVLGLRTRSNATVHLLKRWRELMSTIACGLPRQYTQRPMRTPASLGRGAAWALATNDQFALAQLARPLAVHPDLDGLRMRTLDSRFNWRGASVHFPGSRSGARNSSETGATSPTTAGSDAGVIVRHDGWRKAHWLSRSRRTAPTVVPALRMDAMPANPYSEAKLQFALAACALGQL